MTAKAYVLIDVEVGSASEVVDRLSDLERVLSVDAVSGQCDIIMVAISPDLEGIGDLVSQDVHTIPGVKRTSTCLALGPA